MLIDIETGEETGFQPQIRKEKENVVGFDAAIDPALFTVLREVRGTYHSQDPHKEHKEFLRIDRILIPSGYLVGLGWLHGPIGVDLKSTSTNPHIFQKGMHQIQEYRHDCSWDIAGKAPNIGYSHEHWLSWTFLYPFGRTYHFEGSFANQNRLGTVEHRYGGLTFWSGNRCVLSWGNWGVKIGTWDCGHHTGSR